jgi:hypothetical protein
MSETIFAEIEQTLAEGGPAEALDRLILALREQKDYHRLFDALIVRKRHAMGLPLVPRGKLTDLPEPLQKQFEDYYIEACREVGQLYLDEGNIPQAWLYLNTIGETDKVAEAIERLGADDVADEVIEVAFQHGAHPRKGFEFIMRRYGVCSAITCFEQLAQAEPAVLRDCARLLLRQLHRDLTESIRRDIENNEGNAPEGTSIPELIEGRDWLFGEMNYHVDTSHLSSVVRFCRLLEDKEDLALAVELTEYGRRLSSNFQFPGEPPFENVYEDHRIYFRTLLGQDVEAGIAHFRAKLDAAVAEAKEAAAEASQADAGPEPLALPMLGMAGARDNVNPAAEVLVGLLARVGRTDEAIAVSVEHLKSEPVGRNGTPSLADLCRRAGDFHSLAEASRRKGDLVNFTAALVEEAKALK